MNKTSTVINAREIGYSATLDSLRTLLVEQFQVARDISAIDSDDPLFSAGVGLSSLEGMELLATLEARYGVAIVDLDYWVDEPPTVATVARYLIDHTPQTASST